MGGTIILIMPILLFGVLWVSYVIATKIYHLLVAKNNAFASTARVITFIVSILAISTILGILLLMLIITRIK
jgi:hypothetical protein